MSYDGANLYSSHEHGGISIWDAEKFKRLLLLEPYDQ